MIASSQNIPIKRGIKRVNERETKRQQRERKGGKGERDRAYNPCMVKFYPQA